MLLEVYQSVYGKMSNKNENGRNRRNNGQNRNRNKGMTPQQQALRVCRLGRRTRRQGGKENSTQVSEAMMLRFLLYVY